VQFYPAILSSLDNLIHDGDSHSSTQAMTLKASITTPSFIVATAVIKSTSSLILPLSQLLQKENIDIIEAIDLATELIEELERRRNSCEFEFNAVFSKATSMAESADVEFKVPRVVGRQTTKPNAPSSSPEEHFRRNTYIPYIDHLLLELKGRFSDGRNTALTLQFLVPVCCSQATFKDIKPAVEFYASDLDDSSVVAAEFQRWCNRWNKEPRNGRPKNALDALSHCPESFYPNLRIMLQTLATLPVSAASAERTFSVLKRVKSYLRSTMSSQRLCGLAHLSINRDLSNALTPDEVIDYLAHSSHMRLEFALK
jgi:hypothetical protein